MVKRKELEMAGTMLLQKAEKLEIQKYQKKADKEQLKKENIAFTGSPRKYPEDGGKIILIADPFCANTYYYEFKTDDITYVEELPNLVNTNGETIPMARVWIKKLSVGIRATPFIVEEIEILKNA